MGRQERGSRLCYNRIEQRKSHLLEAVVTGDQVKPQNSSWQAELALTQPSLVSKKSAFGYCTLMHSIFGPLTVMNSERSQGGACSSLVIRAA